MRALVIFLLFASFMSQANISKAQDINFDDLKRTGTPIFRSVTLVGASADAGRAVQQFQGTDSARVESDRQAAAAAAQRFSQQPSQQSSGSSSKFSGKKFVCEVECTSRTSSTGSEPLVGKLLVTTSASDSSSARVDVRNDAGNACKSSFGSSAWYRRAGLMAGGGDYITCRESR